MDSNKAVHPPGGTGNFDRRNIMYEEIIITERPNGRATVEKAYVCNGPADFIGRIQDVARRSDETIATVEDAVAYLNDRHAQTTAIVSRADFEALTVDSWDQAVLDQAERLGWYTPAEPVDD